MDTTLASLDMQAVTRMALVFMHMVFLAMAGGSIALGDYAIFGEKGNINAQLLEKSANCTLFVLAGLWITGASIIWLDTHFDPSVLMTKDKLLAKLTIAIALSVNGVLLHHIAFPTLTGSLKNRTPLSAATVPAILGGISLASWLYAAFLGEAKPVAAFLGYKGFVELYIATALAAVVVALVFIRPRLALQMANKQKSSAYTEQKQADKDWLDSEQPLNAGG